MSNGSIFIVIIMFWQSYTKAIHGTHRKPEVMKDYYAQYSITSTRGVTMRLIVQFSSCSIRYTSAMGSEVSDGENRDELLLHMARKVSNH